MKKSILKALSLFLVTTIVFTTLCFYVNAANDLDAKITNVKSYDDNEHKGEWTVMTANTRVCTNRWSSPTETYICNETLTTVSVLDATQEDAIHIDTYRNNDYQYISSKTINYELEIFGGFYSGENYNYIVFGQDNYEENPDTEVIRLVKYDKNFNRISSLAIKDCYTSLPFDAGRVSMAENGDELIIHTSRLRYATDDTSCGSLVRHQSQLTILVDTANMTIKNTSDIIPFQSNHVSHSFNQFAQYDGDTPILVDHGDSSPRSVCLTKYTGDRWHTSKINLFTIPGEKGANCTGVMVGGFEISNDNYLVAINSIDHSKVTEYTSFEMIGLDKDERDVILLVSEKNNTDTSNVKQIKFTNYINNSKLASSPYLVKVNDNKFVLLWQEFEYITTENNSTKVVDNGLRYVVIDGDGNQLSNVFASKKAYLSTDCQPTVIDGKVVWYVNNYIVGRTFYVIDPDSNHVCTFNKEIANDTTFYTEATFESPAKYFKSCSCGNYSDDISETFTYGDPRPVLLESISIENLPEKTRYYIGDTVDTTGLSLTLLYNNGTQNVISTGFTIDGYDMSTSGNKTVTVTYNGLTTTYRIYVEAPTINVSYTSVEGTPGFVQKFSYTTNPVGQTAKWESSNPNVVSITDDGTATAISSGTAVIKATFTYNGYSYSDTCDVTVYGGEQTILKGDVNSDGSITAVDARLTLQSVAGLRTFSKAEASLADMNGDNYITAVDARIILQMVAGLK